MPNQSVSVFVPGSIGNVGPGFDVLGLAVDGLGDRITAQLLPGGPAASQVGAVTGRDQARVPRRAADNCAVIAALSLLHRIGDDRGVTISIDRSLPLAGGLGASAAASVGGALAAAFCAGLRPGPELHSLVLAAALDGEGHVAGRHLDNIAPSLLGGLTVVRSTEPPDVIRAPVVGEWWLALASPAQQLATKTARSVLPTQLSQHEFIQQMAHTAALLTAFATGDQALAGRALVDHYAEPRRAPLIEQFAEVKAAALKTGALGCSISGAGPSVFALCATKLSAERCGEAMRRAFAKESAVSGAATLHIGRIADRGATRL